MNNGDATAQPFTAMPEYQFQEAGLTKREHFAGLAMQAMLGSKYYGEFCNESENNDKQQVIAQLAISSADALLAELDKKVN